MKADLATKVLCLKASFHFAIISNLFFLLTFGVTIASIYAYFTCPEEFLGHPVPDEMLKKTKEEVIMKALGGITLIPFIILSFISGFMSCIKFTPFFALCTLISLGLAVGILGYDCYVLFYLKLKYVWPPHILLEVQQPVPPGVPITTEDTVIHFTKILIGTVTFAMFAVVSILLYCSFVSANLSFLYKAPAPPPRPRSRPPMRRKVEEENEVDETDTDENEEKKKDDVKKSDETGKKKENDEKKEEQGNDKTKSEKRTVSQSGTGTGAD